MRSPETKLTPSPLLGDVTAYSPPRAGAPVDLHLDGNEGLPPPAELLEAVVRAGPGVIRRYPKTRPMEVEIAAMLGVAPERVLVTAGADDALERILRAMLAPGRQVVLPVPTFGMLARYSTLAGGEVVEVPWLEGALPVEAMLEAVTGQTAVITVVTPNSPSGLAATTDDLGRLSRGAPHALLLVDLAYTEFADEDLTRAALELPNAVITRTLSKAWGLAGLRVGYAAGCPEVIGWMKVTGHPYAVSAPSLTLAQERLRTGRSDMEQFVACVRRQRSELIGLLAELGASALPSQGNFVLGRFADATWVRDGLAGLGISVRLFPGKPYLEGCLRITVPGDDIAFIRLCSGLRTVLAPRGIVLALSPDDLSEVARERTTLERLSQQVELLCLASRDRDDLAEAIQGRDLTDLFTGVVSLADNGMELIPEVEPGHRWMVTLRPEAAGLARSLGMLPLGWTPEEAADELGAKMTRAGAGRILSNLTELEELLP